MAGGQGLSPEPRDRPQQLAELHPGVAEGARERRLARQVGFDEGIKDALAERRRHVEDVVRDAEPPRHGAGHLDVDRGAAARHTEAVGREVGELEGDPDDLVPLPHEQRRRHGGVHTARHRDRDPHRRAPAPAPYSTTPSCALVTMNMTVVVPRENSWLLPMVACWMRTAST